MISFIFPIHRSISFECSEDDIRVKKHREPVKRERQEPVKIEPKKRIKCRIVGTIKRPRKYLRECVFFTEIIAFNTLESV